METLYVHCAVYTWNMRRWYKTENGVPFIEIKFENIEIGWFGLRKHRSVYTPYTLT